MICAVEISGWLAGYLSTTYYQLLFHPFNPTLPIINLTQQSHQSRHSLTSRQNRPNLTNHTPDRQNRPRHKRRKRQAQNRTTGITNGRRSLSRSGNPLSARDTSGTLLAVTFDQNNIIIIIVIFFEILSKRSRGRSRVCLAFFEQVGEVAGDATDGDNGACDEGGEGQADDGAAGGCGGGLGFGGGFGDCFVDRCAFFVVGVGLRFCEGDGEGGCEEWDCEEEEGLDVHFRSGLGGCGWLLDGEVFVVGIEEGDSRSVMFGDGTYFYYISLHFYYRSWYIEK